MPKRTGKNFLKSLLSLMLVFQAMGVQAQTTTTTTTPVAAASPSTGGACNQGDDTTDDAGKGNDSAKQNIVTNVTTVITNVPASSAALQSALNDYTKGRESCVSGQSSAAMACLENCSSNISSALSALNGITAAVSGAETATGSCSKFGDIMKLANDALTAYSAACATMKGSCVSSCTSATTALTKLKTALNTANCAVGAPATCAAAVASAKTAALAAITQESQKTDKTSSAGKGDTCSQKYTQLLASAAAGIAAMIAGMMAGNSCATATAATATTVDCTDPTQAQTPTCLCLANPRLTGCDNALEKAADATGSSIGGTSATTTPVSASNPDLSSTAGLNIPDSTAAAAGDSTPAGGAGSPLGGSSLPGSPDAKAADAKGSGLDANILAGTSGGGGGGGWGTGSGSGADKEKYKDFLPGGKRDPAAAAGVANQVTGGGGKSNWEKVRDRYIDNKPSLLSN